MASNGCLPGTNGQSCHAPRFFKVTCLLTLHLCIAFTHATVAPVQYWPLEGTTLLYGYRAACEHSEQFTDMARKSTQNTSQTQNTDKLSQSTSESYCIHRECDFPANTGWKELVNRQACLHTDTLCLHSTNTGLIARLNPGPRRITNVDAFLRVAEKDVHGFGQPIYQLTRPITPKPRQDLANMMAMLPEQKLPSQQFEGTHLTLATAVMYKHSNTTMCPMQATLLNSQSWQHNFVNRGIVKQPGIQETALGLTADLKIRCSLTQLDSNSAVIFTGPYTAKQTKCEGANTSHSLPIGMNTNHGQNVHHDLNSSFPHIHQQDTQHHLPYTMWGMTRSDHTTCNAGNIVLSSPLVTHMYSTANLIDALTVVSQMILSVIWAAVNSIANSVPDINAKSMHSWQINYQYSELSSQAIQAYRLSLRNGVYMQRSLAAGRLKEDTSNRFLKTCSNVSYALLGELAPLVAAITMQTLSRIIGMLTSAPMAVSKMKRTIKYKNLLKCSLCYCLICIKKIDCVLSDTHGVTHLVLICCELATMHEYIKGIVEHTGPYSSLPALACMMGLLIVRIIWLGQMLNEEHNARHNSRPKAKCRIDHPKCANGKYWSRIRYGQRKAAKQRQLRNQSKARWVTKWLWRLLHKAAIPVHACARLVRKWGWRTGGRSRDDCAARGAAAQAANPKGGCSSGAGQHLRMQPASKTKGLHMEKQLRKFCQIHALNALLGRSATQPADILSFCEERAKEDTGLGRALKGSDTWSPTEGNFCDMVINAFLHYHSSPTVRLSSVADNIPMGSEETRFLSALPAGHDAFVLRWNCGSQPHEDTAYGHAVCVRKRPVTKERLNSERGQPVKLTSIDWPLLKGSVYVLAEGSAYGQNQLWNAIDEGYTQVFDDSKVHDT